ncbi:MAG: hypothetical protein KME64_04030 [Scytonematopsis contorta HA4267-MV1]|jgi:hypothetical protein|nr:hypothetical protein [Scytonematopsis contorta HA4267-MV1]
MLSRKIRTATVLSIATILTSGVVYLNPESAWGRGRGRSSGGRVSVRGYYRSNGTYVRPHTRSAPGGSSIYVPPSTRFIPGSGSYNSNDSNYNYPYTPSVPNSKLQEDEFNPNYVPEKSESVYVPPAGLPNLDLPNNSNPSPELPNLELPKSSEPLTPNLYVNKPDNSDTNSEKQAINTALEPSKLNFPFNSCGDKILETSRWYPVFIDGGNLDQIRIKFCKDAYATSRKNTGEKTVQVASFNSREKALFFAKQVNGEVGELTQVNSQEELPENIVTKEASQTPLPETISTESEESLPVDNPSSDTITPPEAVSTQSEQTLSDILSTKSQKTSSKNTPPIKTASLPETTTDDKTSSSNYNIGNFLTLWTIWSLLLFWLWSKLKNSLLKNKV